MSSIIRATTTSGLQVAPDNSGSLQLQTNGTTTAVTIDTSQNVGIGTASPSQRLNVGGTVHITGAGTFPTTSEGIEIVPAAAGGDNYIQAYSRAASSWQKLFINSLQTVFGTSGSERMRIDSSGNVLVTGSGSLGYGTGSGGTVTQATSKTTGVTLNKPTGQITMSNAALGINAFATFTFTNSFIATKDTIVVSGAGNFAGPYRFTVDKVLSGSCSITVQNNNAASQSEAVLINFAIIKGATS